MTEKIGSGEPTPRIRRLTWRDTLRNQSAAGLVALGGALLATVPAHFAAKESQVRISGGPIDLTLRRLEKQLVDLQALKKRTGEAGQGWFNKQWLERLKKDGLLHWALEANEPTLRNRIALVKARKETGADAAIDFMVYATAFSIIYSQIVTIAGGAAYAIVRARQRRRRENEIVDVLNDLEKQLKDSTETGKKQVQALGAAKESLKNLIDTVSPGEQSDHSSTVETLVRTAATIEEAKANFRNLVRILSELENRGVQVGTGPFQTTPKSSVGDE